MITANSHTQLKSVLQFRPESGELAGDTFNLVMNVCSNPACDCGYARVNFYGANAPNDHPIAMLDANVFEDTLDLPEEHPPLSSYIKGFMEAGMSEADWEAMQRVYYLYKNIMSEDFDVKSLDVDFPENLVLERNIMQPYFEYLPAAEIFQVKKDGEAFELIDIYCVNPDCLCTELNLAVYKNEELQGSLYYDYKSHETVWRKTTVPKPLAEELLYAIHRKHPDLDDKLNRRNGNLRALFAKFLMKKGAPTHPVPKMMPSKVVGRNEPCPCGSGKKYKRCCGK